MADTTSNTAATQAVASKASKIEPITLPEFGKTTKMDTDLKKYTVKYLKVDMDDLQARSQLEILETRSIRGEDIVVLNKDKFTFMDRYFLIVTYMEYHA